ncbi:MAG: hypothetical protein DSY96_05325 [SAR324 cluster bacterium]|uniref:Uncharacterized protein n=1 Tax=SAR324 cluster bacterium TaxID=2024889 RepID=A0A432GNE5_9DELT|nr:MAG: hypothetical protein DSY96_05325 [SAR324 cluster bacterium]
MIDSLGKGWENIIKIFPRLEMTPHLKSLWIILFFISRLLIQVWGRISNYLLNYLGITIIKSKFDI